MKKNKLIILFSFTVLLFTLNTIAQTVNPSQKKAETYTPIVDANFEKALIELGIDSGPLDQQVLIILS